MKKNYLIIGALAIVLIFIAITGINAGQEETMTDETMTDETMMEDVSMHEESAYDFELMNLNGETVKLSDYRGQEVYVKYWASWCSICLAGLEELDMLASEENDFTVLTIVSPNYNGEQSEEEFKEWFSGLDYKNINVLLDNDGVVTQTYGVRGYPTSAYIDSNGMPVKVLPGHNDNETIKNTFETIE